MLPKLQRWVKRKCYQDELTPTTSLVIIKVRDLQKAIKLRLKIQAEAALILTSSAIVVIGLGLSGDRYASALGAQIRYPFRFQFTIAFSV